MKRYKYFNINDLKKEKLVSLRANNKDEAFSIASKIKNLPLESFKKIFGIELL